PQTGGALLRRYARRSGCEPSPRQRHDAEPLPPPGAALARCPDAAPAGCHRQGAHCCADTPGVQGANRRRASGMMLSRCRHPTQRWRVARMQLRQVATDRGRTAVQIRPAFRVRTVAAPAA
ncbi:hypothetical protein ABT417_004708, partial [Escherichia coli]